MQTIPKRTDKALLKGPLLFESAPKRVLCDAQSFSPLDHRERGSLMCDHHVSGSVSLLGGWCRPSTILRRIRAVIVDAVQLMNRRWAQAHIGEERIESSPAIAYGDASTAIARIARRVRVQASCLHGSPNSVLRIQRVAMSEPVAFSKVTDLLHMLARCFTVQATTRLNMTVPHITEAHGLHASTFTATQNDTFPAGRASSDRRDREAASGKSNQFIIGYALHCWIRYHNSQRISNAFNS